MTNLDALVILFDRYLSWGRIPNQIADEDVESLPELLERVRRLLDDDDGGALVREPRPPRPPDPLVVAEPLGDQA